MAFRLLQLNCQRSRVVMYELGQALCDLGASVALVQEPYCVDGRVRGLPGGMRVYTDSVGDSAIVVNDRDVDCTVVSQGPYGVCVGVEWGCGKMLLASIYCRFRAEMEPYLVYMDTVLRLAGSSPLILCLDANATSTMWFSKFPRNSGSSESRVRGELLGNWMIERDISVLNEPSEMYTFDGPSGVSDIDVTAANGAAMTAFGSRWRVCDGWGVSDHNLIEIVISDREGRTRVTDRAPGWRVRDIDWTLYADSVRAAFASMPIEEFSRLTVDDQVALLERRMSAVNDALLGRRSFARPSKVRWWSRELNLMRRNIRRLRSRFQAARRSNADDLPFRREAYLRDLRTYKDMLARAKEEDWRSFVRDNRDDPWGLLYRVCRRGGDFSRQVDFGGLEVGGTVLSSWGDCARELMGAFFPDSEPLEQASSEEMFVCPGLESYEVESSIRRIRGRKSPGMDGMTGQMYKSIWRVMPEYLLAVLSRCVEEGYFPRAWKCARVVVLLKSPERVRSNPRSYRGISLLPVLGKVLERVMVDRLKESNGEGTSPYQFGFVEGRSTVDAWLYVQDCVSGSNAKYVLGIFVDFKGAFDNLLWRSVLARLVEVGCQEIGLWRSYFSDRRACVVGASETVWKDVVRGCPQGSICGPFIWNLMMDSLLQLLARSFKVCAYADDLLILVEGQSRAALERLGEEAMRMVREWGDRVGVEVAAEKTVLMLLKGRLASSRPPLIRAGPVSLRYSPRVKYLGVVVSERLRFLAHLDHVKERLSAVAVVLRRILRSDWGLSRRAARTIYAGLFVACATYGAPIWYRAVMTVHGREKVTSCQRSAMLACAPLCRTVSSDAMQVLLGAAPLDLEVIRRAVLYKARRGLPVAERDWLPDPDLMNGDVRRLKAHLLECLYDRWRTRWTDSDNGRVTYRFIGDATFVVDRPDFGFGLSLGFLLTGHGSLNAFLHRRGLATTAGCPACGGVVEDVVHLLTECPYYSDIRDLGAMGISYAEGVWDLSRALLDSGTFARLATFARAVFGRRRMLGGR